MEQLKCKKCGAVMEIKSSVAVCRYCGAIQSLLGTKGKGMPNFKISSSLPKYDIKKGQQFLDQVTEAFNRLKEKDEQSAGTPSSSTGSGSNSQGSYQATSQAGSTNQQVNTVAGPDYSRAKWQLDSFWMQHTQVFINVCEKLGTSIIRNAKMEANKMDLKYLQNIRVAVYENQVYDLYHSVINGRCYFSEIGMRDLPDSKIDGFTRGLAPFLHSYISYHLGNYITDPSLKLYLGVKPDSFKSSSSGKNIGEIIITVYTKRDQSSLGSW